MYKILKWLAPLIAVGVAVFIVFFLVSINSNIKIPLLKHFQEQDVAAVDDGKKSWLDNFAGVSKSSYSYPVNELFVKVDLQDEIVVKKPIIKTIYQLRAPLLDPYQMFCLQEELRHRGFNYSLKKDNKNTELFIYAKDKERLLALVEVLKNYQISAKIAKISQ